MKLINQTFLFFLLFIISCTLTGDNAGKTLKHYDFEQIREFFLPSVLREISGLAFLNGKIYTHNDEKGIVYILDPETGKTIKEFFLGVRPIRKDFEGIAAAGEFLYLVTSSGVIYKFREPDSSYTSFEEIKTPLSDKYDIEGLCYDESTNSLLLAAKSYPRRNERNVKPVFTFNLETQKLVNRPRFIINVNELKERFGIKDFSPSGIEKHADGNFYILSSSSKSVAVLSYDGKLLEAAILPGKHMQPEGITFLPNNYMVISDEGGKDDAELTIYPYKPPDE